MQSLGWLCYETPPVYTPLYVCMMLPSEEMGLYQVCFSILVLASAAPTAVSCSPLHQPTAVLIKLCHKTLGLIYAVPLVRYYRSLMWRFPLDSNSLVGCPVLSLPVLRPVFDHCVQIQDFWCVGLVVRSRV